MKFLYLTFTASFLIVHIANAQLNTKNTSESFVIEFATGIGTTNTILKSRSFVYNEHQNSVKTDPQIAISVTGKIYKLLYIKALVGTNNINALMNIKLKDNYTGSSETILSWYSANYISLSFLPEVRVSSKSSPFSIFANVGVSSYVCNSNYFYSYGFWTSSTSSQEWASKLRGNSIAFETNGGVLYKWSRIGINATLGFVSLKPTNKMRNSNYEPVIGFTQFRSFIGLVYLLK